MATRIFAHMPHAPSGSGSNLSDPKEKSQNPRQASVLEFCRRNAEIDTEGHDGLGCMRGVAAALGIQAIVLILALAIWKLH